MKTKLINLHWLLASQFGIDPLRTLRAVRGLPYFVQGLWKFRKGYKQSLTIKPCLHDRYEEGGATDSEYFWQDLLVARWLHTESPKRHVDVGSRVDGFVAHVASFREVEVFDVRPITTQVPGIIFREADLMNPASIQAYAGDAGYCDSLSCLHAIEHFGLGRYGDPIDPHGYEKGIANLVKMLKRGGTLYLSAPLGQERVEFNANWVFDPRRIKCCAESNGLTLKQLTMITTNGPKLSETDDASLAQLARQRYQLGIFIFKKEHF